MKKEMIKTGSFESIPGKILILGSRATFNSLKRGMFYTSNEKGNIIWEMLDAAFSKEHTNFKELQHKYIAAFNSKEDVSNIKNQIISLLNKCNIGLSDVLLECESSNSLDTSIKNAIINPDLEELCLNANVVLLNGSTAGKFFKKEVKNWNKKIKYFVMPSTSCTPGRFVKSAQLRIEEWSAKIKQFQ